MILYGILTAVFGLIQFIFYGINLPDFPTEITTYLYQILDSIKGALPLIWVFFDKSVVTVCIVCVLALMTFEKAYDFIMWLVSKLPIGIRKQ